jgi:hypothetical protein
MSTKPFALPVYALAVALASACTSGIDPNATYAAQVNEHGGTVGAGGSAQVQIGAGALKKQIVVAVGPAAAPTAVPAATASKVIELTPHGTTFAVPARVSIKYDAKVPASRLRVLRLADDKATQWKPVGGASFKNGEASFETTTFSYYTVADGYACTPVDDSVACSDACGCCGGATCVDLSSDPRNCGACGNACDATSFCSGSACVPVAAATLCENKTLLPILGEIVDLSGTNPSVTTDSEAAATITAAIAKACGASISNVLPAVQQAQAGVLDPCTDAPLAKAGTTLVITGGNYTQRVVRYLEQGQAPVRLGPDPDPVANPTRYRLTSKAGQVLADFDVNQFQVTKDYFVVSLVPDAQRGALVLDLYGIFEPGTLAATWYFVNQLLPSIVAGKSPFASYLVVQWTDDGDLVPGAGDTFTILAQDVP